MMAHPQSPEQRRTLAVLVAAQLLSGAGLAAGVTVGALLAQDMLDTTSLAGIPSALFTIGSAAAAVSVGRVSDRAGRRSGLALGYAVGALGSVGVVAAAVLGNVAVLFGSLFVYGAGTATNLQARYAGADLARPERRGRAVSTVLVATTLGAVVGPNLVTVMGDAAAGWGIPRLAGPFVLAAGAYALAALVLWAMLRPDPLLLARTLPVQHVSPDEVSAGGGRSGSAAVGLGATIMVVSQLVMVAIMTMTPIHMQHHGHSLGAVGVVIAIHVGAMFLPSPISGSLVDSRGPRVVAALAAAVLAAAGLVAAFAPTGTVAGLAFALGLLGLGWNLGLVSGTAIITDAAPIATRARTQGRVDLCIALAGAGGGLGSGLVMAAGGYPALGIAGGVIALLIVPALMGSVRREAVSAVVMDHPAGVSTHGRPR